MTFWIASAAVVIVAYLLGSIPTAYIAGKALKGIDIREHGSGSSGATNALRTLGPWPALAVLLVDVAKGAAPVLLALRLLPEIEPAQSWTPWIACLAGLAALLGHSRSMWLNFTGGKSVATGLGVLLTLSWPVGLSGLAVFAIAVAAVRIVSLGSILAAAMAAVLVCALDHPWPYRLMIIAGAAHVILRHRANLQRMLAGTEPRLGQRSAAP